MEFCTGNGIKYTAQSGAEYPAIGLRDIADLMKNPDSVDKNDARWLIPSTYRAADAREHDAQREKGAFGAIVIDLDSGNHSIDEIKTAIISAIGNVAFMVYATKSATPDDKRWRVIIPRKAALAWADHIAQMRAVLALLSQQGIKGDPCAARAGQVAYLPNRGEHYEYLAHSTTLLSDNEAITEMQRQIAIDDARKEESAKRAKAEREKLRASRPVQDGERAVDTFNANHSVTEMLEKYGYQLLGRDYRSPQSTTGSYAVRVFDQTWVSLSGTDYDSGIGVQSETCCWGDAFDLFVHYEHGGDYTAAVRAYGQEVNPSKPTAAQVLGNIYDFPTHTPETTPPSEPQNDGGMTVVGAGVSQKKLHRIFTVSDVQPVLSASYLIKGWLGRSQMSVVYGPSNVGKSFYCLDMAFSVAADQPWNGARVKGGAVLYLATEGGDAFRNRLYAIKEAKGVTDAPLLVRPSPIDLLRAEVDMPALMALCDEVKAEHGDIQMIVVDTLSRAMAGGNENGPEDMTRFIANVDALRDLTGAHIMIVHHSGKDTAAGARGHSSLRAATDTEIELEVDESGLRMAKTTKQRDMEPKPPFGFKLDVHKLGLDEDGDTVTTCTILPASEEDVAEAKAKRPTGANQVTVMKAFKQLRSDGVGKPNPGGTGWPERGTRWCILESDLKQHAIGKLSDKANPHGSYSSAMSGLISNGFMERNDGYLWCLGKEGKATL